LALGAIARRASWKTRDEARKGFLESPFFRAWDPRVLELYIEWALYSDEDSKTLRLKTAPIQEAIVFNDAHIGGPEAWVRLWKKELDPRIKLRWATPGPGKPELDVPPQNAAQHRVWLRPENASNIRIAGSGHLIVQEKPEQLGREVGKFLKEIMVSETKARL
jgi:pimeloyl-ACP methyl ester carboxylesterase